MKLIKLLLKLIFGLIFIVVIIAITIPFIIDPNDYKQQIAEQVKLQTGRDLKISGDITASLSLPSSIAFELGATEMSHPGAFAKLTQNPFIQVNQVAINASILPLIQENRLEIGKIILDKANIYLIKDKQGKTNWESFSANDPSKKTKPLASKEPSASKKPVAEEKLETKDLPEITIAGVEITNSTLFFDDLSTGQQIELNQINLTVSELKENTPIDVDFNLRFKVNNKDPNTNLTGNLSLKTQADINLKQQHFQLNKMLLDLSIAGKTIPGGKNTTTLSANIILDLAKQQLMIEQLTMGTYQLDLIGDIKVTKLMTEPQFKGQLTLAEFSPKELMKQLDIAIPELKNPQRLSSSKVHLRLSGNAKQLKLTELDVSLDDISIKGDATVLNFTSPSYLVNLSINKLFLDDYAVVSSDKINEKKPTNTTKPSNNKENKSPPVALIPVKLLKSLNINGQLKIAELSSNGIKMSHIILGLKSKNGLITLDPVQSDFYKGKLELKTTIDVRKKTPKIAIEQKFNKIDLGQLLLDATGTKEFTGTANISSKLTSHGNFQSELIKNTNGKGNFLITDGSINKLEILHNVRQAYALLQNKPSPTQKQKENTAFTELKGSVNIKNGVLTNKDLFSKSPVLQLTGAGYADLSKQYLDYTLNVFLLNSMQIDKQTNSTDFKSKAFPYTIKGKFSELSQQASLENIVKQQAKEEANKQVQVQLKKYSESKQGKKIEDAIGKDNMKKLQGLFKF
jgi:AsmA protein